MSIKYIVGNPGSGKTYYAVHEIYTRCKEYDFVYTNINGFDFEAFDNVKMFAFASFEEHLSHLYAIYSSHERLDVSEQISNNIDLKLIEYSKKHNLHKCLFVIDEVHNVFKEKNNPIIVWWLTYHRHLFADFILITQDLSLVHNEYKRVAEFFFRAVDGQKRLFQSSLRYVQYSNHRMYQNSIIKGGGVSLKKDPIIYKIYHSGEYKKTSSFVVKYLIILAFLFLLTSYLFYDFLGIFEDKANNQTSTKHQQEKELRSEDFFKKPQTDKKVNSSRTNPQEKPQDYAYFISCIDENCYIGANYELIPLDYVLKLFNELKPYKYVYKKTHIKEHKFMAIFKSDVFEIFKKRKDIQDESNEDYEKFGSGSTISQVLPFSRNN